MEVCVWDKEQTDFNKAFGVCSGSNPPVVHQDESWRCRSTQLNGVYEYGVSNYIPLGKFLFCPYQLSCL